MAEQQAAAFAFWKERTGDVVPDSSPPGRRRPKPPLPQKPVAAGSGRPLPQAAAVAPEKPRRSPHVTTSSSSSTSLTPRPPPKPPTPPKPSLAPSPPPPARSPTLRRTPPPPPPPPPQKTAATPYVKSSRQWRSLDSAAKGNPGVLQNDDVS